MYPMKIVMDTSVLVAAFRSSGGSSYEILQRAKQRRLTLMASPALFLEYEEVLSRAEQRAIHGLTLQQLARVLDDLAAWIVPVEVHFKWRPQLTDPDDEMVLEAAINGRADWIITYNRKDFTGTVKNFGIRALTPAEAIKEMNQ